ncbi:MAG: acetate--CoA ligase family protein [Sphingomicrobium sp.]
MLVADEPTGSRRDGLDALFRPRSVAIVGASNDPARTGGRPLRYLLESGFAGPVWPVNPGRETVQGVKAYASVRDLPEAPDVALIAVPASSAAAALRDCAARGARAAIVFSAGFGETGEAGRAAQDEMMAIARSAGIRVLGPNCLGAHSAVDGFIGTFGSILDRGLPIPGPIGIVSQSGAFGMYLGYLAQARGLGVSHAITTGNEIDVDVSEALLWLVSQPHVKVILVYVESIRDGGRFIAALRAARKARKPVIVTKVGASETGARAAGSHTDALSGPDAVFDAVLRQYGGYRATTTEEQLDVAYAAALGRYPAGNRLGIVTGSGGIGVQMCDAADRFGLIVPPLPAEAQQRILDMIPYAAPANPIDVTAQALSDMSVLERSLRIAIEDGGYDTIVSAFLGLPLARPFAAPLRNALLAGARGHDDRLMVLNVNADPDVVRDYEEQGFLVFEDATRAVRAVAALDQLRKSFDREEEPAHVVAKWKSIPDRMNEVVAKRLLAAAGVPTLEETLATSADVAIAAARRANGPVALKIVSPDLLHKTEIGGVLLGVTGDAGVREGFDTLLARGRAAAPDARIEGVLVTPMAGEGIEMILGVANDPAFGPVVMVGLGGIFVELMGDVVFRHAPFDIAEARAMIDELAGRRLLDGMRGAPPSDVEALGTALAALSRFAAAHAHVVASVDINPFLVRPQGRGAVALDAVIVASEVSGI